MPPLPGREVRRAEGARRDEALFFDGMERRLPIGLSRDGEPVFANLDFLDGSRGAHVSISGISGVATKTSYATFLLHSLFTSRRPRRRGRQHARARLQRQGRGPAVPRPGQRPALGRRPRGLREDGPPRRAVLERADPRAGPQGLGRAARRDRQPRRGRAVLLLDGARAGDRAPAALPVRRVRGRLEPAQLRGGPDRGEARGRGGRGGRRARSVDRDRRAADRRLRHARRGADATARTARSTAWPKRGRVPRLRGRSRPSSGGSTPRPGTSRTSSAARTSASATATCSTGRSAR